MLTPPKLNGPASSAALFPEGEFTLLMVEDNPDDRFLLERLLEEAAVMPDRIDSATGVEEAIAAARARPPGLILLDLNLPDSSGLRTLERIREAIPGAPVVVMTGGDEAKLAFAAVQQGAQDFLVKGRVDAWTLTRTLRYAVERHRLVAALEAARAEASHRATHDTLTGLPNRALFDDRIAHALCRAARQRVHLAVVFLDLDRFKSVNDRFGHAAGDAVLCEVARRLTSVIRGSDTVARLGGDEFGVLFEEVPDHGTAVQLAEMMRSRVAPPIPIPGGWCTIGASLGLAVYPDEDHEAAALMQLADARMYADKEQRHQR